MKTTVRRPFSHTRLTRFLEKRILELRPRKSQIEIAAEAGFVQTNMLAMIKNGSTKLPLDRVPGIGQGARMRSEASFLAGDGATGK